MVNKNATDTMEYIHTVLPMKKILKRRFLNIPASFWDEDEMKIQYIHGFRENKNV